MHRRSALVLVLIACGGTSTTTPSTTIPIGPAATSPSPSPPPRVRWALPTCPLRYEVLTTERFEGTPPYGATELVTFLSVDAATIASGLELRLSSTAAMKNGKHRPYAVPDTGFPPLVVATDGGRWHVVGDSVLFAGLGSQGGLAWLFPDFPDETKSSWDFPVDPSRLNQNGVSVLRSSSLPALGKGKTIVWSLREETSTSPDGRLVLRARGPERWSSRSPAAVTLRSSTARGSSAPSTWSCRAGTSSARTSSATSTSPSRSRRASPFVHVSCSAPTRISSRPATARRRRASRRC